MDSKTWKITIRHGCQHLFFDNDRHCIVMFHWSSSVKRKIKSFRRSCDDIIVNIQLSLLRTLAQQISWGKLCGHSFIILLDYTNILHF